MTVRSMTRSKVKVSHEPFKVGNPAIFKSYLLCHLQWELATDYWFLNYGTISKFDHAGFFIFVLVFVSRDFELGTFRLAVCTSVRPQSFFHFSEIGVYICRGRWVIYDGMQYDPIQGQGQGHEPFKVGNPAVSTAVFSTVYNASWQLTTDS